MSELITIVVPVYNRENLVLETLNSIYASTYRPIEVVVADDGSTDATVQNVSEWSKPKRSLDFRVKLISKSNGGVSSARNFGMVEADGQFIMFLDSDDLLYPNMVRDQIALMEETHADYAFGKTRQVNSSTGAEYAIIGRAISDPVDSIPDHNWHISSLVVRRDVVAKVGTFDETLRRSEDWEFACRVKAFGGRGVFNNAFLTEYRVHGEEQLIKSGGISYAKDRQTAIKNVYHMLKYIPTDTRRAQDKCTFLILKNRLSQIRFGNYGCNGTDIQCALNFSSAMRRPFYIVAYVTLSVYCYLAKVIDFRGGAMLNRTIEVITAAYRRSIRPMHLGGLLIILHPKSYLRTAGWFESFNKGRSIDATGAPVPWHNYAMIGFLEERVRRDMDVFEYGCGNSTKWYSGRARNVIAVEHDRSWCERINFGTNVEVRLRDATQESYVKAIDEDERSYDIIVIDGLFRNECAREAVKSLTSRGVIVFDDSERMEFSDGKNFLDSSGFRSLRFRGPKPSEIVFAETTIFYKDGNVFNI